MPWLKTFSRKAAAVCCLLYDCRSQSFILAQIIIQWTINDRYEHHKPCGVSFTHGRSLVHPLKFLAIVCLGGAVSALYSHFLQLSRGAPTKCGADRYSRVPPDIPQVLLLWHFKLLFRCDPGRVWRNVAGSRRS